MYKILLLAWILVASCTKIVAFKQIKGSYETAPVDTVQPTPPAQPILQTKVDV